MPDAESNKKLEIGTTYTTNIYQEHLSSEDCFSSKAHERRPNSNACSDKDSQHW
jgi:hypothetical protein